MRMVRALATVALVTSVAALVPVRPAAAATSMSISWSLPGGKQYQVGIDHVLSNGSSGAGYEQFYEWPNSIFNNNPVLPNPVGVFSPSNLSQVRIEFYQAPPGQTYDERDYDAAVAVRLSPSPSSRNIGAISFPAVGAQGSGVLAGDVRSRTATTNGRVRIEIFQTTGQPTSSTGLLLDAFSAGDNVGGAYHTGPLWNGQYIAFVTDTATGRQAVGLLDVAGETDLYLDLDVPCFGIDECQWSGSLPTANGEFHATAPTRIVDSRSGLGIPSRVKPGDGRNSDPNPVHRLQSRQNHEFVVTGVGGVPSVGVSAVMLNVTVTGGTNGGSVRLFPKPPRTGVFADQSSYPASNAQAPALWWNTGEARASLQLVEVGVGGRIRVDNVSFGEVHLVVDVVGWVDQGQPGQAGSRLLTITPTRFLDTRNGTGGSDVEFGAADTRALQVSGRDGIPADAEAVVGTLTSVNAEGRSFQTVWPAGGEMPVASVLNSLAGQVRPNLVNVAVGEDGSWSLYNDTPATDLLFDAVGCFTPVAGSGGDITAVPSSPVYGPTTVSQGADIAITVTGKAGVPASGVTAVWVQLTVNYPTAKGYLTAYPNGVTRPNASNLNWIANQSVGNLALVPVGSAGAIRVFNATGSATVSVSVVGWVN